MKSKSVTIDIEIYKKLKDVSIRSGKSIEELVDEAIKRNLPKESNE